MTVPSRDSSLARKIFFRILAISGTVVNVFFSHAPDRRSRECFFFAGHLRKKIFRIFPFSEIFRAAVNVFFSKPVREKRFFDFPGFSATAGASVNVFFSRIRTAIGWAKRGVKIFFRANARKRVKYPLKKIFSR